MTVYLIHFKDKIGHSQHYIGYTGNLDRRIAAHRGTRWTPENGKTGDGATLLGVANSRGVEWKVVRVWPDGDYDLEKKLKARKKARVFCPVCKGKH